MAINVTRITNKIYKMIKGNSLSVKMYSDEGSEVIDPDDARRFFVDEPRMMITVDEEEETITFNKSSRSALSVYSNLISQCKVIVRRYNYTFVLKEFAKTITPNFFSTDAKKKKNKNAKKNLVDSKINYGMPLYESISKMFGSRLTSKQKVHDVQVVIKHKTPVDESIVGARSRNIQSIFIESSSGRIKFPYNSLIGARALASHLSYGGSESDEVSQRIIESTGNIVRLSEFIRCTRKNKLINEHTSDVIELAIEGINDIKSELNLLINEKTYAGAVDYFVGISCDLNEDKTDMLKDMFTVRTIDAKVESVLPILNTLYNRNSVAMQKVFEDSTKMIRVRPKETVWFEDFVSEAARVGNEVMDLSARIIGNENLSKYIAKIGYKMISETDLTDFEKTMVENVIRNAVVEDEVAIGDMIVIESFKSFKNSLDRFDIRFQRR